MGLGALFKTENRSTVHYTAQSSTGESQSWVVNDLSPDWSQGEYQGGMGLPGAWRVSVMLSDLLGGLPWQAYREQRGKPPQKLPTPSLLEQPTPPDPRVVTFSSIALDVIWHGNGIGVYASRDRNGVPTSLLPVPAELAYTKRVEDRDNAPLPTGTIGYKIGRNWYSPYDVLHIKGACKPGALRGMGVLENHMNTLTLNDKLNRQARNIDLAAVPTGTLKSTDPDYDEEDGRRLKAGWQKSQRDRTVAVLSPTTEYTPLAWTPEETQLLEARKFSLHELALIFGVDPAWLGVSADSQTYQNQETKGLDLLKFSSLSGHLARFEQTLSLAFPRGTRVKANLDALLRSDTLSRYQAHEIGIRAKFLAPSEARALEERPQFTEDQLAEFQQGGTQK